MKDSVFLLLLVRPKARRDEIVTWGEGMIKLHVKAPPIEGEANEGCRRLLANIFGISTSKVTIKKGESSRFKKVQIIGVSKYDAEQIRQKWLLQQMKSIGH